LRVMIKNSYNASSSVIVKIGAIRMRCMNGMVVADDLIDIRQRHVGDFEIKFPEVDRLWEVFCKNTRRWTELSKIDLPSDVYSAYVNAATEQGIVQLAASKTDSEGTTAWDLYNQFTYHVTHESKASELGKFNRLARVDKWVNDTFELSKVA